MKLFITLFLAIFSYTVSLGQEKEEQKINLMCEASTDSMVLYIIDGEYYITEKNEPVIKKIGNSAIQSIRLHRPGTDEFKEEIAKTDYANKIYWVTVLELRKGTKHPFKTKDEKQSAQIHRWRRYSSVPFLC